MAMDNGQVIDAVRKEMLPQDRDLIKEVKNGIDFLSVSETYPNIMNAFIETLTNKVTKSLIYSKIFVNPLKMLKKGKLDYGDSIEELFVEMAMSKNFGKHWDDRNATPEADLIRKLKPKVTALYISVNYDQKYKTTIMDKQLRKAFINEGGLSRLVVQIIQSITNQAEFEEFKATKKIMNNLVGECKSWNIDLVEEDGYKDVGLQGRVVKQTPFIVNTGGDPKKLIKEVKRYIGDFQFPSDKYNLAKELNWARDDELIFITTSEISSDIDVNVLASAFNVSMTDMKIRTILVDEMPKGIFKKNASTELVDKKPVEVLTSDTPVLDETKEVLAILCDKDLFQIWDTYQGSETFRNGEGKYTNYFANREGIYAVCTFANMVIFYKNKEE